VTMHSTMMTGRPSREVRAVITWPTADSSATMYRNSVTSVMKLR
jgi:hypothetical protein